MDALCLFLAYYFSKRRIIQNTEPIVDALKHWLMANLLRFMLKVSCLRLQAV